MKRVLIVDDEPCILRALKRVLRTEFEVEVAVSGAEALSRIDAFHPDVVISDMRMPGMNGDELLAEVQRQLPGCRLLLFSGGSVKIPTRFEILQKPCGPQEILERLRTPSLAA